MAEDPKFVVHGSQVQKWTDDIQQLKQERDSFRKQRDELINDMAEIKRKAEAFDEIKEMINWFEENDRYEFEGQVGKIIKIIKDSERGSDDI
ncbi:hypothetical protein [Staphylococcus hominis]|uniref:hypothetical protein n=1 Tax=Staphylococcus hominis TaxID=1290 RepID=UPI00287AC5C5|nr:hypothetical protein [Staphylococcus hominis]MDS3898410.1 hypothetical protein [Staphylococcus hominis]